MVYKEFHSSLSRNWPSIRTIRDRDREPASRVQTVGSCATKITMRVNLTKVMSGRKKSRKNWGEGALAFSLQSPRFYCLFTSQFSLCRSPLPDGLEIVGK